ncbi:Ethanolamine kinase [Geodia barretti]|uniref:ethanolamine kinase n=1 Tax=Geodia barretti TaxID=519541 RepID=A0AA35STI0_GEOBA|nr:Ethanolamine kinase [Geodia barretti]
MRLCNLTQCEEVLEATSRALARYHSIPPPPSISGRGPWVWRQARTWMKLVSESLHTDDLASPRFKQVFGSVEELRLEMEWLRTFLRAPSTDWSQVNGIGTHYPAASDSEEEGSGGISQSACVLCHNDPQPLNFVKTPTGSVVLIDMEYSDVNYAAFDVGAFFCEFAGVHGTLDYSRYPSEIFQKKWIRSYLHECARIKGLSQATVSDAEVDGLYKDANNFAMVAHFIWSLWSLIQSKNSKINFDYLDYGCARYTEFKRRKSIIISQL